MMGALAIRRWAWVHRWSSLVCTVFMLLLCLTGLPLIFHHEIGHLLGTEIEAPPVADPTARVHLDRILEAARARQPERVVQYVSQDVDDDSLWYVTLAREAGDTTGQKTVVLDARNGEVLGEPRYDEGFMHVMFKLHVDLFAGLPGTLFLGFMGLLLLVAIVSGVVLYAPFMRKLDFGTVRREPRRSTRLKWLDLHNLLGIVSLVWALVVGLTGVVNTLATPLVQLWQQGELAELIAPYRGQPIAQATASLHEAVRDAQALAPGMTVAFIAFPGTTFSSPYHYAVFVRGNEPLTARLFDPVLVDARSGAVTASPAPPWYVRALQLSQPLHFGDYGGMPMKVLWAVLDLITIVVLGSGLYLWFARRQAGEPGSAASDSQPRTGRAGAHLGVS